MTFPDLQLHRLFERHAARRPDAVALVCEEETRSYAALHAEADRLAHALRARGVTEEAPVALFVDRSVAMIAGLLAILKAGGACVALDRVQPAHRLALMLQQVPPVAVVTTRAMARALPPHEAEVVYADDPEPIPRHATRAAPAVTTPASLAYVVFTSGSEGQPKAVAVEHHNVTNYVHALAERLGLGAGTSFATVASISADLGYTAIFGALCTGGALHVMHERRCLEAHGLAEYCARHPIDVLKIVPSHLAALCDLAPAERLMPRRLLVLGGEALEWSRAERWQSAMPRGGRVVNHYGPTECTIGVLVGAMDPADRRCSPTTVPLGRPLRNTHCSLRDEHGRAVPSGATGELWLGGAQVARGYFRRADLTAARFVADPGARTPGARMYRTGDLCRALPGGALAFVGRIDRQVKVHGFRIELGEIEHVLGLHPAVTSCAVGTRTGPAGDPQLVAHVVPRAGAAVAAAELGEFLARRLPRHMLPAKWMIVDRLPRLPNDKIDRQALSSVPPSSSLGLPSGG